MRKVGRCFSTVSETKPQTWRKTFEDFSRKYNIGIQDWYQLEVNALDESTAKVLKTEFKGSLYRALSKLFPEIEWYPWRFRQDQPLLSEFWIKESHQRQFFDDLGKKIGIQTLDDWYEKLSYDIFRKNGGSSLLRYKGSPQAAIWSAYPEYDWIPWKFKIGVPRNYWSSMEHQRKYFDWLGKELGVKELDDWYEKLSYHATEERYGGTLLSKYKGSPIAALTAVYPNHNWFPWKFRFVSHSWWKDKTNQRKFFDHLAQNIGIQNPEDWYQKLTYDLVETHGGSTLLSLYSRSPATAVMAVYPEHRWVPWKFRVVPRGYWNSSQNVKWFLSELSEKLSIQTLDDWYRVDWGLLVQLGASSLLTKYRGLFRLLKEQYPHHPWDPKKFESSRKKAQRWLLITLKKLFPNEGMMKVFIELTRPEILEDYRHPRLTFHASRRPIQLDVFIPALNLAFEYQGRQHYEEAEIFSPVRTYQRRDEEKRILCAANKIKLIEVPYWWSRTQESLQDMIANFDGWH